ncbi:protein of unknown function [Methanocaldococcus lauensis]|nr:protein of unknown function [Methanocaldococcus lauensis]
MFAKIKESIKDVVKEGKMPVLVIDELQKLKNIYFNGNKTLLNELFNLFVSLTKMEHLCHVICLTSDTLFIEEIYRNSTLENTSEYYLIDWLSRDVVKSILREEGFNKEEIDYCLKYISLPYEISTLINKKKPVKEIINQWINIKKGKLKNTIRENLNKKDEILKILLKFKDNIIIENEEIEDELYATLKIFIL